MLTPHISNISVGTHGISYARSDGYDHVSVCSCDLFQDRMISMTLDKDSEVAVQTMKLLLLISK